MLHIEDLCEAINNYQGEIRRALQHCSSFSAMRAREAAAKVALETFLSDNGISVDFSTRTKDDK